VEYVWVGIGGFVGANARYGLSRFVADRLGGGFPYGTLLVNVSGSLAIGVILTLLTERLVADPAWRLLLVVGFLGGYTTFSSYTFETLALLEQGAWGRAAAYVAGNNLVGVLACYGGMVLARVIGR
jgi:fluoride exporter